MKENRSTDLTDFFFVCVVDSAADLGHIYNSTEFFFILTQSR